MERYCYIKKNINPYKKQIDFVAYSIITIGALFLFWSLYPLISYELYAYFFIRKPYFSPLYDEKESISYKKVKKALESNSVLSTNLVDYTKASSWFPNIEKVPINIEKLDISEYRLSIPSLGIENARVVVGGEDLSSSLVQYQPLVLPGQLGKAIIFGHSIHPALYKNSSYKGIFTYLPTIKIGDSIIVTIKDKRYEFIVFDKFEVKPDVTSVLEQEDDDAYIALITCTPPGSVARRAVVLGRLKKPSI